MQQLVSNKPGGLIPKYPAIAIATTAEILAHINSSFFI